MTRVRWTICALLFFATTVNYLDRQLFSALVPFFEDDLKLGPTDLALINVSFLLTYGFGMVFVGRFIDRVGTKKGFSITFLLWNIAAIGHGLVTSITGFAGIRILLGLGESGNFPACVKTVAEWFPRVERATATGVFNSGSNLGAVLAPILAVKVAEAIGWRSCFLILGGIGMVWIVFWNWMYRRPTEHPKVSESELAFIQSDPPEQIEKVSYSELFGMRPVYAVAMAKFFTDAPWWFYLTWLPKFLIDQFHLSVTFMAVATPIVYLVADGGAISGGWLSSTLIKRGRSVGASRKLAMLTCALCAVPVMSVGFLAERPTVAGVPSVYLAVTFLALAAAAHQGWSSNVYTVVSDTLPKSAIAMAVGVISCFGGVGAAAFQFFVGSSVKLTGSYVLPFMMAGSLYLIGLLALHLLLPKVEPVVPARRANLVLVGAVGVLLLVALAGLQFMLNKPPYLSASNYLALRQTELRASGPPVAGPTAAVGWMKAQWYKWTPTGKEPKLELVKFDREDRPIVEGKGAAAPKYRGPSLSEVQRQLP